MIQTILFDLDGTLVDSRKDLANAVNFALESAGLPVQKEAEITPHIGNGLRMLMSEVMGPVADEALEAAINSFSLYYADHCVDHTVLYDNVAESLEQLRNSVRFGVVTNKPERFARVIIEKLGLGNHISTVIGGDSLAERKPHPAPVIKAINDLGGTAADVLVVGDGSQDILAGQSAGTLTCLARYGFGFRPYFSELKPDFQINRFNELKEIVK